jgi:RHS repeat-associated protein
LGTPRVVTRSTVATGANAPSSANATSPGSINKAVWMWNSDPFGTTGTTGAGGSANSAPNKNPQNITGTAAQIAAGTFEQNLRMPGQVEDPETKKFYNWNRTYANDVGRYDSSDPIGLRGGLNTFGYVKNKPIRFTDPMGLLIRGQGCTNGQWAELQGAEQRIRKELSKCDSCHKDGDGCIPCSYKKLLLDQLAISRVDCGNAYLCGSVTEPGTDDFTVYPPAFVNPRCSCLALTVFHELLHNLGLSHSSPKGDRVSELDLRCRRGLCTP